jgi:hypothetical protein
MQLAERLSLIIGNVSYKDWDIVIINKSDLLFIQVEFNAINTVTGVMEKQTGRKFYISPFMTDSEIVQTAFLAIKTAEEHELRELFTYKGSAVFGPHMDLNELSEVGMDAR